MKYKHSICKGFKSCCLHTFPIVCFLVLLVVSLIPLTHIAPVNFFSKCKLIKIFCDIVKKTLYLNIRVVIFYDKLSKRQQIQLKINNFNVKIRRTMSYVVCIHKSFSKSQRIPPKLLAEYLNIIKLYNTIWNMLYMKKSSCYTYYQVSKKGLMTDGKFYIKGNKRVFH